MLFTEVLEEFERPLVTPPEAELSMLWQMFEMSRSFPEVGLPDSVGCNRASRTSRTSNTIGSPSMARSCSNRSMR